MTTTTRLASALREHNAKYIVAMMLAQKYGVDVEGLIDLNSPQAMEQRALQMLAQQELSQLKAPHYY